ncbi:Rv3235 family protein [Kytococcus sp. Marseille-QA3725]
MSTRGLAPAVDFFDRQPTATRDLPPALPWAAHLSRSMVEVMEGSRDAQQLARWVTPEILTRLARRNTLSRRLGTATGSTGVRTVRACHVRDGIVEVTAVVVVRGQVRALALRLEGLDGRWLLTVLEMG